MQKSATAAFDVQILRPLIRQRSPSPIALVVSFEASEPAPGLDDPKHMDCSPAIIGPRISFWVRGVIRSNTWLGPKA
jgi:hypothetical protein